MHYNKILWKCALLILPLRIWDLHPSALNTSIHPLIWGENIIFCIRNSVRKIGISQLLTYEIDYEQNIRPEGQHGIKKVFSKSLHCSLLVTTLAWRAYALWLLLPCRKDRSFPMMFRQLHGSCKRVEPDLATKEQQRQWHEKGRMEEQSRENQLLFWLQRLWEREEERQ